MYCILRKSQEDTGGVFGRVAEAGLARPSGPGQSRPAPSGVTAHVWYQVCNELGPLEIVFCSTHAVGLRSQLTPTTKPRLCLVVG